MTPSLAAQEGAPRYAAPEKAEKDTFAEFALELRSHAEEDYETAISHAEDAFLEEPSPDDDATRQLHEYQIQSARELFFIAEDFETSETVARMVADAVTTGLENTEELSLNEEVRRLLERADLMLMARATDLEQRPALFTRFTERLTELRKTGKLAEDEFFREVHEVSHCAWLAQAPDAAFSAIDTLQSLSRPEHYRAYLYLIQRSDASPAECRQIADRLQSVVERDTSTARAFGYDVLACGELYTGRLLRVVEALRQLQMLDLQAFARETPEIIQMMRYVNQPEELEKQRVNLIKLLGDAERALELSAAGGPLRDQSGRLEEPHYRYSVISSWIGLGRMDRAMGAFKRSEDRAGRAREILEMETGPYAIAERARIEPGSLGADMRWQIGQLSSPYMLNAGRGKIASGYAALGNWTAAQQWVDKISDQRDRKSALGDVGKEYATYLKSANKGSEAIRHVIDTYILPPNEPVYAHVLENLAKTDLFEPADLQKRLETFAQSIELRPDDSGHELLTVLKIANEHKLAVPHAWQLARHLADNADLETPAHRAFYLARLTALETRAAS